MKSTWVDRDAQTAVDRYAAAGVARDGFAKDLALRVYTTRLLGADPKLVLHGGGNTSVKTRVTDLNDDETDVLCVKGSGWDMGTIEP
jgi:rhamnose utilization protein RhaD (predicted bifunctional aldolase and dehydrogenase)